MSRLVKMAVHASFGFLTVMAIPKVAHSEDHLFAIIAEHHCLGRIGPEERCYITKYHQIMKPTNQNLTLEECQTLIERLGKPRNKTVITSTESIEYYYMCAREARTADWSEFEDVHETVTREMQQETPGVYQEVPGSGSRYDRQLQ